MAQMKPTNPIIPSLRRLLVGIALLTGLHSALAETWQTHFAYSNVEQIAVTPNEVFGLSDGSLYSVNKFTEQLTLWNLSSGLHATDVCCIGYDGASQTLVILYSNGKMDLLKDGVITYVGDLYLEDMTASKQANTIVFRDGLAYLGMHFGLLTFDLQKREFPDTYYVGAEASDQDIQVIFFDDDLIYAATDSLLFSAPVDTNLVDFRSWTEQPLPTGGRLFDLLSAARAQQVTESAYTWSAAGALGIAKSGLGVTTYYKPDGPLDNNPYRMTFQGGKLYVVPGARWAVQSWNPAQVSYLQNGQWFHITNDYIQAEIGGAQAFDFLNVAVSPNDPDEFFVTSYGTGLYRFRNTTLLNHWTWDNSGIQSATSVTPECYTRTEGAVFDSLGNLWMMNASGMVDDHLCIRKPDGTWFNLNAYIDGSRFTFDTPGPIVISNRGDRYKWLTSCRNETAIVLLDDHGTPFNTADDRSYVHKTWVDQNGLPVEPEFIYCSEQDPDGGLWVGTSNGPLYIPSVQSFIASNACQRVRFLLDDGQFLMEEERVNCIYVDPFGRAWIGTQTQGIYIIAPDRQSVEKHLLPGPDNPMPSACVLSIAYDAADQTYYIGTGGGIVSYREQDTALPDNPYTSTETFAEQDYSGMTGAWTLHFAYQDITQIAVTPSQVYGLSEGALFSVTLDDEQIHYFNRLTGLSDANIASITYDPATSLLLILYANGNIDLLSEAGDVWNIPDLRIKQLSGTSKVANAVTMYNHFAYLAMPFGIMQVNMRRHEIADTYHIGPDGTDVDVTRIAFRHDSIYATTSSRMYFAALAENLVDYHVWHDAPLSDTADIFRTEPAPTYTFPVLPNGPATNMPYSLTVCGDRLIALPGGRWAQEYQRPANVMIYDNGVWSNIRTEEVAELPDWMPRLDFVSAAIDPRDEHHFYVGSFGTGLYEYYNDAYSRHYSFYNSPGGLEKATIDANGYYYTRVDGLALDGQGNVWMMNASSYPNNICILTPDGSWRSFNFYHGARRIVFETPGPIIMDAVHPNYRWMISCRTSSVAGAATGVGLLDDNGTPLEHMDDRMAFYSSFTDQFGSSVSPDNIYCASQDRDGDIWVGTNEGLFAIPSSADFFNYGNCKRFKINRNDGSGLADFLLDKESIRAIAHDGGNRHWIGTATNGVFLIQYRDVDDVATIYHFTTSNSPLPSNNILSIAILPDGEVFFGTDGGLASFRSDASTPAANYNDAYVFPNPVRPGYEGNITFTGLVDGTYVKVLDAAGNEVFFTRANGGTAVWNGRNASGRKVTPGVYHAYCNTVAGAHTVINVLIL